MNETGAGIGQSSVDPNAASERWSVWDAVLPKAKYQAIEHEDPLNAEEQVWRRLQFHVGGGLHRRHDLPQHHRDCDDLLDWERKRHLLQTFYR